MARIIQIAGTNGRYYMFKDKTILIIMENIPRQRNIYLDISGYEGLYAINRDGDVWNYKIQRCIKQRVIKRGYYHVKLCKQGVRRWMLTHRIVANTFIYNGLDKPQVNHKDLNKLNNSIENLEWVTASENMMHAQRHGRVNTKEQQEKIRKSCGYLTMEQAEEIRRLYKLGGHTQKSVGKLYGVSEDVVWWVTSGGSYKEIKDVC